jgi:hypothetical protein
MFKRLAGMLRNALILVFIFFQFLAGIKFLRKF